MDSVENSDVGDNVMLVILWWWPIEDVVNKINMLATFFVMLVIFQSIKSVTYIFNRSSTA